MGFDRTGWRIDDTVHPFATRIGGGDVRITTRWDEHFFPTGLYGAMHECGHGLYEAGLPGRLRRSPDRGHRVTGDARVPEPHVGKHGGARARVLHRAGARIAALAGGELSGLDADALYRAVNRVKPTFIRVEADEATYALHIILRYELEQELVEGTLAVRDLPEAWNARFEEYLGIPVTNDIEGVLQDVHWSAGLIGYFPTYALGNLIAGQLWERAHTDIGRPRGPARRRRAGTAAGVAQTARPSSWGQVHDGRAAGTGGRRTHVRHPVHELSQG